ncbi:MAG: transglutaminase family protein [Leptospiraceae bacterium]|nr:transglutaminase family protein [Leptospiraceae bacterium]
MTQRYSIVHKTTYEYEWEAVESYTRLKVSPLETLCQSVNFHSIEVKPDVPMYYHRDFFDNLVHEFSIPFRHRTLEIVAKSDVSTFQPSQAPATSSMTLKEAKNWFLNYQYEFYDFISPSFYTPISNTLLDFARKILSSERKIGEAILDLNEVFTKEFKYKSGSTNINTPIEEVIMKKSGVCQDFAHTMIAALRCSGIAARYVSGYIESYDPESNPDMIGSEQSHAWLDVYIPEYSWFGLDPTNNMASSDKHVRIGVGRDFEDVSPVRGTFTGSGAQSLRVDVKMRRIDPKLETPIGKLQGAT